MNGLAFLLPLLLLSDAAPRTFQSLAAPTGTLRSAPGQAGFTEEFRFDPELASFLSQVPVETSVRVSGWPLSPGKRAEVVLTRHEIYSRQARIVVVEGEEEREIPRSSLLFFWGAATDSQATPVMVALDPVSGSLQGISHPPEGTCEIRSEREGKTVLNQSAGRPNAPRWICLPERSSNAERRASIRVPFGSRAPLERLPLQTATLAVETDNELMRFYNDDTTRAANEIARLFATMNLMYERDLKVRLLIGTTLLRVTTNSDPYFTLSDGTVSAEQLDELSRYWSLRYGSIRRALVVMLSGKQPSPNSASGKATVGTLGSATSGYSFTQLYKIDFPSGNAEMVGHEIGHNFGTEHTHCYGIDQCYSGQPACYSGPTSCPAPATYSGLPNVTGTIMSYCDIAGIGGCTKTPVFHPETIALLDPILRDQAGVSLFPEALPQGPLSFFTVSPCRLVDTRGADAPALAPSSRRLFSVTGGGCGIPATARSLAANLTATEPTASGALTATGGNWDLPGGTLLSFGSGRTRAAAAHVLVATDGSGTIAVWNQAAGNVPFLLDVTGYYR